MLDQRIIQRHIAASAARISQMQVNYQNGAPTADPLDRIVQTTVSNIPTKSNMVEALIKNGNEIYTTLAARYQLTEQDFVDVLRKMEEYVQADIRQLNERTLSLEEIDRDLHQLWTSRFIMNADYFSGIATELRLDRAESKPAPQPKPRSANSATVTAYAAKMMPFISRFNETEVKLHADNAQGWIITTLGRMPELHGLRDMMSDTQNLQRIGMVAGRQLSPDQFSRMLIGVLNDAQNDLESMLQSSISQPKSVSARDIGTFVTSWEKRFSGKEPAYFARVVERELASATPVLQPSPPRRAAMRRPARILTEIPKPHNLPRHPTYDLYQFQYEGLRNLLSVISNTETPEHAPFHGRMIRDIPEFTPLLEALVEPRIAVEICRIPAVAALTPDDFQIFLGKVNTDFKRLIAQIPPDGKTAIGTVANMVSHYTKIYTTANDVYFTAATAFRPNDKPLPSAPGQVIGKDDAVVDTASSRRWHTVGQQAASAMRTSSCHYFSAGAREAEPRSLMELPQLSELFTAISNPATLDTISEQVPSLRQISPAQMLILRNLLIDDMRTSLEQTSLRDDRIPAADVTRGSGASAHQPYVNDTVLQSFSDTWRGRFIQPDVEYFMQLYMRMRTQEKSGIDPSANGTHTRAWKLEREGDTLARRINSHPITIAMRDGEDPAHITTTLRDLEDDEGDLNMKSTVDWAVSDITRWAGHMNLHPNLERVFMRDLEQYLTRALDTHAKQNAKALVDGLETTIARDFAVDTYRHTGSIETWEETRIARQNAKGNHVKRWADLLPVMNEFFAPKLVHLPPEPIPELGTATALVSRRDFLAQEVSGRANHAKQALHRLAESDKLPIAIQLEKQGIDALIDNLTSALRVRVDNRMPSSEACYIIWRSVHEALNHPELSGTQLCDQFGQGSEWLRAQLVAKHTISLPSEGFVNATCPDIEASSKAASR